MASSSSSADAFLADRRANRLESYRNSPEDITAHYSDEGQIQADYHKRFAFELIQNADDAMQGLSGQRTVRFELHDGALLVANTGRPIDEDDVKALCTMSYTTKGTDGEKRASIGHKGRGFSSVLEITDRPQIFSTGISFEFDEQRSRAAIADLIEGIEGMSMESIDGVPLMRLPFDPEATPDRVAELLDAGYNTVFRFELKNTMVKQDVVETIGGMNRNTVVFLQELERLEIQLGDENEQAWQFTREAQPLDSEDTVLEYVTVQFESGGDINQEDTFALFARNNVAIGDHTGGIDDNTWGDVEYTQIGLALRAEETADGVHIRPLEELPNVHVFLPTEVTAPIPALINGAFHTAISRTTINVTEDADNYNGFLLEQVADLLSTDIRTYLTDTATTVEDFIECLDFTHLTDDEGFATNTLEGRFIDALRGQVANVSFVPRLEILETGDRLPDPGTKSISDIVLPFYTTDNESIAEATARIYGNDRLDVAGVAESGWFPKTSLLRADRAAILQGLGASTLGPAAMPRVLGAVPDERSPLIPPESEKELAVDPILQVVIWVWKAVQGNDEQVVAFKQAATEAAVFPVGSPDEDWIVNHVASTDRTQLFIPPERATPDIELSGLRFLTRAVYRPESRVKPSRQSELIADLKPALEAIWDINEFNFEQVIQAAVFPKLPEAGARTPKEDDSELQNKAVIELVYRLAQESIDATDPLPFVERDGTLYRLSRLPVPTRDGDWKPAYTVYFGAEWQPEEPEARRIEPLLDAADVDAPYLAPPESLPGGVEFREDHDEEEELEFFGWRRFFRWLGVSQHIRLTPFFEPTEERNFTSTIGISRPDGSSVLARLNESDWNDYQRHLQKALEKTSRARGEYDSIYQIQGIEFFNQFLSIANENEAVAKHLFKHLTAWWQDDLREYRHPVLATHDVQSFGRRNQNCPSEDEKRRVGLNLWLWQLKRSTWCPGNRGREKPENLWLPTDRLNKRFTISDVTLLPVLDADVLNPASDVRDLLHDLGIRSEPTRDTFAPGDAEIIATNIAEIFEDAADDVISDSLREIKPVYRYISELLPPLDSQGRIGNEEWLAARDSLQEIEVLCRQGDHEFVFVRAEKAAFIRSRDVLDRIPVTELSMFILQEDEAARFGSYFGLRDLEREAVPSPEFIGELPARTEEVVDSLEDLAPYVLCRLEAERPSQELIDQDTNGMREFLKNLMIVEEIRVMYRFDDHLGDIDASPDYFLDARDRSQTERPLPFVGNSADDGDLNRFIASALCDYLDVSQFEGIITLLNAESDTRRLKFLKLAGAPSTPSDIEGKTQSLWDESTRNPNVPDFELEREAGEPEGYQKENGESQPHDRRPTPRREEDRHTHPVYETDELSLDGETITFQTDPEEQGDSDDDGGRSGPESGSGNGDRATVSSKYRSRVDRLGMWVTMQHEYNRLRSTYDCANPEDYVFDIHDARRYEEVEATEIGGPVVETLEANGIPEVFPGFDILVVNPDTGEADRLIELKSSGHDIRNAGVTWNEWKTARDPTLQDLFYLYIVGNLRKDIPADPYVKAIPNPFQLLHAEMEENTEVTKEVKVDVTSFRKEAEITKTELQIHD